MLAARPQLPHFCISVTGISLSVPLIPRDKCFLLLQFSKLQIVCSVCNLMLTALASAGVAAVSSGRMRGDKFWQGEQRQLGYRGFVYCLEWQLLGHSCHSAVFHLFPYSRFQPQHVLTTQAGMLILPPAPHGCRVCTLYSDSYPAPKSCCYLCAVFVAPVSILSPSLLLCSLQFPHLQKFNVRIFQTCLYAEQGVICWIIAVQFVVTSIREIRRTCYAIMLLTLKTLCLLISYSFTQSSLVVCCLVATFFFQLISYFKVLQTDNMLGRISIFSNLLRLLLCPNMWYIFENVPCAVEKNV